jgi:hypothetical protein
MLKASGLPGILEDVIKDLYRSEVSRLSKALTRPVADVIFRPAALAPDRTVLTVPEAARREVFDPSSMPSKFLTPSYVDRLNRTWAREQVVNSVRRAARR